MVQQLDPQPFSLPQRPWRQHEQGQHNGDCDVGGVRWHGRSLALLAGQPELDLENRPRGKPDQRDQDGDTGDGTMDVSQGFHGS